LPQALLSSSDAPRSLATSLKLTRHIGPVITQLGLVNVHSSLKKNFAAKSFNLFRSVFEGRRKLSAGEAVLDREVINSNNHGSNT
jgi:hypothetical protein